MADKKGFTLMELIVVMVIVAICLGLAIPSFVKSIEQTGARAAQNNLYAIAAAQEKFYEDWSSYCISTGTNPTGLSAHCGDTVDVVLAVAQARRWRWGVSVCVCG